MNTSAPAMASASVPVTPRGLLRAAISALTGCMPSRPTDSTPLESTRIRSRTPAASRILAQATPAAPAPAITTRRSTITRWITDAAFISAASTTTAVPCWSSCITGMSRASTRRCSTSKQRGAEMSSRLIAPNEGAIAVTAATISSGIGGAEHDRHRVEPGERLHQRRLALHHRQRGLRSDVAEAQHRGAVGDDGDHPGRPGVVAGRGRIVGDQAGNPGHPGRVEHRQVAAVGQRRAQRRPTACRRDARSARRRR